MSRGFGRLGASNWEMPSCSGVAPRRSAGQRHSTGYALVNKGTDIRIIQGYLGHKAISSTVRYTKLDSRRFAKLF